MYIIPAILVLQGGAPLCLVNSLPAGNRSDSIRQWNNRYISRDSEHILHIIGLAKCTVNNNIDARSCFSVW